MSHIVCLSLSMAAADSLHAQGVDAQSWVEERMKEIVSCGVDCLYVLMQSEGYSVAYEKLEKSVEVGHRGSSLLDLRRAATALGMECDIMHGTYDDLVKCHKPVIAHFTSRRAGDTGHYVIVLEATQDGVRMFDTRYARVLRKPADEARPQFSGYLLIPRRHPPWSDIVLWLATFCFWGAVFGVVFRKDVAAWANHDVAGRSSQYLNHPVKIAVLLFWLLLACLDIARGEDRPLKLGKAALPRLWRTPEHDAVNSLYVVLHASGYDPTYQEVLNTLHPEERNPSMLDVKKAACQFCRDSTISRLTPNDLTCEILPLLTLQTDPESGESTFCVLCDKSDTDVTVFQGASATLAIVPLDLFRRTWSSYVLVLDGRRRRGTWLIPIGYVVLVAGYVGWHRRNELWRLYTGR